MRLDILLLISEMPEYSHDEAVALFRESGEKFRIEREYIRKGLSVRDACNKADAVWNS